MKRSPMKRTNPKRRREKYARNFGERAALVRAMGCLVQREFLARAFAPMGEPFPNPIRGPWTLCGWATEACHVRARGMGGAKGDRSELVPLCAVHHRESGEFRTTQRAEFEARYGLDLTAEAAEIAALLDDRGIP